MIRFYELIDNFIIGDCYFSSKATLMLSDKNDVNGAKISSTLMLMEKNGASTNSVISRIYV